MPDITRKHDEAGRQRPVGGAAGDTALPMREFRMNRRERVGNAIVSLLVRAGIGPIWLLTTRGRMTGRPRTNPVVPVLHDGRRWLVAPYGAVSWVHNARAALQITLRHGRDTRDHAIREVGPDEAAPVLKRTSASPLPPDRTFKPAATPRWRTSSPRPRAGPCSS